MDFIVASLFVWQLKIVHFEPVRAKSRQMFTMQEEKKNGNDN